MEPEGLDRYTVSNPEPIPITEPIPTATTTTTTNIQLNWKVSIYRDGKGNPVDTFLINNINLPPRIDKKTKKIKWQLPNYFNKKGNVNLGADDLRRVLEIYKERKVKRKKESFKFIKKGTFIDTNDNNTDEINNNNNDNNTIDCYIRLYLFH
jgi:hypothetical protein